MVKTIKFTYDAHKYHFLADEGQYAPDHGDIIRDSEGKEVCQVLYDGEYFHAETPDGDYASEHENEENAAWGVVLAVLGN